MPFSRVFFACMVPYAAAFTNLKRGKLPVNTQFFYSIRRSLREESYRADSQLATHNPHINKLVITIDTPDTMMEVGAVISSLSKAGDVLFLDGDLGAGKTCFARGFIGARSGLADLRVTSPTYLLCNTYPTYDNIPIHHMDLYRLSSEKEDFSPLNLHHVFQNCISLIEWPSRLTPSLIPEDRLGIIFRIDVNENTDFNVDEDPSKPRTIILQPFGESWIHRLNIIQEEGYFDDLIIKN